MKLKWLVSVITLLLWIGVCPSWGQQEEDPLLVVPDEAYENMVEEDAEIVADTKRYTLINNGVSSIQWKVEWESDWLTASPDRGVLPAQDRTNVVLRILPMASSMPEGVYTDTLVFTNILSREQFERDVQLTVVAKGTGAISVIILPDEASSAGGQWRISNITDNLWRSSGDVITGLQPDNYTITFRDVDDYITPLDTEVSADEMESGQVTLATAIYQTVALAGFRLSVSDDQTINPDNPVFILEGAASGGSKPYEFQWSVARRPVGSGLVNFALLTSVQSKVSTSLGDPVVEGNYEILLSATDSDGRLTAENITITVDESAPKDEEEEEEPTIDTDIPSEEDDDEAIVPNLPACAPMAVPMMGMILLGLGFLGVVSRRRLR